MGLLVRRVRRRGRRDVEHAALYFERQYDRLWDELKGSRFAYLFARGVLSDDHLRARRTTAALLKGDDEDV